MTGCHTLLTAWWCLLSYCEAYTALQPGGSAARPRAPLSSCRRVFIRILYLCRTGRRGPLSAQRPFRPWALTARAAAAVVQQQQVAPESASSLRPSSRCAQSLPGRRCEGKRCQSPGWQQRPMQGTSAVLQWQRSWRPRCTSWRPRTPEHGTISCSAGTRQGAMAAAASNHGCWAKGRWVANGTFSR